MKGKIILLQGQPFTIPHKFTTRHVILPGSSNTSVIIYFIKKINTRLKKQRFTGAHEFVQAGIPFFPVLKILLMSINPLITLIQVIYKTCTRS